jgi:hypothetical protein
MTLLSVVQNAALVCGLNKPDQVMASTDRTMQEMARLANEMALMIAERHDWQSLVVQATITGDGEEEAFDLPSDFGRMPTTANLWSSRWQWEMVPIVGVDAWLQYQMWPVNLTVGNWIIYGDQFHLLPIMGDGDTVKYFYVSNKLVRDSGGTTKATFTADTDTFRLSERLLELAIIYKWKSDKGQPYADRLADFEEKLVQAKDTESGSKPVISGAPRMRHGAKTAYPFAAGQNTL